MSNIFLNIFEFFQRRKTLLWLLLVAIISLLSFSALRISFVEDISSFFPNNAENRRINDAYQKIVAQNRIVVRFSQSDITRSVDEDLLIDAATRFVEILTENDTLGHIREIFYEVDTEEINRVTSFVTQNTPYFLEESDYYRIDPRL